MSDIVIEVSKTFSPCLGGRYKKHGEYSGEEFRETILKPIWRENRQKNNKIILDFSDGYGPPRCWSDEVFYNLVISENISREESERFEFIEEDYIVKEFKESIEDALEHLERKKK